MLIDNFTRPTTIKEVPGRPTSAELRAMALRQQQQIDSQHQLLAAKEQRLRFLKAQEVRGAAAAAEGERLRRLRERVEAQESKLRRLRALRGQVDLQKTYNVTLSNDLDSIRALFSEKEKELSLAVAKVEALTRQLEDLRRDRRGPLNLIPAGGNAAGAGIGCNGQALPTQAARELEKLRRELMYRNQLSLQQDARLHLQREALQQRQAELRSVDQRIYELQTRLQRKKALNIQSAAQQQQQQQQLHQQLQQHINSSPQSSPKERQQKQKILQQQQQQQHYQQQQQQPHHHAMYAQQQQHQNILQQKQKKSTSTSSPTTSQKHSSPPTQSSSQLKQQQQQQQQLLLSASSSSSPSSSTSSTSQVQQQQQQQQQQLTSGTGSTNIPLSVRPSNSVYPSQRIIPRGNVAAVEPYIHTPQKSAITQTAALVNSGHLVKHSAATANTNQQNQLIQDLTNLKLNLSHVNSSSSPSSSSSPNATVVVSSTNIISVNHLSYAESDETKLARQKLTQKQSQAHHMDTGKESDNSGAGEMAVLSKQQHSYHHHKKNKDSSTIECSAVSASVRSSGNITTASATMATTTISASMSYSSKIPKSISAPASALSVKTAAASPTNNTMTTMLTTTTNPASNECDSEKAGEISVSNEMIVVSSVKSATQQLTVHSIPLGAVNKSVAVAVSTATTTNTTTPTSTMDNERPAIKPKALHQIPSGNLVVPPRKPISSVAPTSVTSSIPKIVAHSPKVNKVAPSIVSAVSCADIPRPALPPKPSKLSPTGSSDSSTMTAYPATTTTITTTTTASVATPSIAPPTVVSVINKAPISEPIDANILAAANATDNLPIKAKPLTIRKQPLSEQPRLKSLTSGIKPVQYNSRRIEMPPAFLFPEIDQTELKPAAVGVTMSPTMATTTSNTHEQLTATQNHVTTTDAANSPSSTSTSDETDRAVSVSDEKSPDEIKRRLRNSTTINTEKNGKVKLARRVSFDPLALLLDASLEGELELVKKTAMQVPNPSAANDEGITALHNAICAGHFEIVKFLVEFGCDVNAQDSDGWTPLHCAASCNNLTMVKFLVENGACLFAATLSDHETPAEKCEEDEEGFDGCSEYLYSIQEKLGILHSGEVCAVFSYDAQQSDELSFAVNDRLTILRKGDDAEREWWWAKNATGEEGYVPRNLLGLYPRVPLQTSNYTD